MLQIVDRGTMSTDMLLLLELESPAFRCRGQSGILIRHVIIECVYILQFQDFKMPFIRLPIDFEASIDLSMYWAVISISANIIFQGNHGYDRSCR